MAVVTNTDIDLSSFQL